MKKIVLIEDDSDLFSLLKYNLEKEGFHLVGSQTGKGAIELCRRERPDLIILDIMLPDSDGIEICKGIRSRQDLAHIPVIFLTARASETDRILGLELGANDYIVKHLVRSLGGEVRVSSTVNQGSTFYFTLPVEDLGLAENIKLHPGLTVS